MNTEVETGIPMPVSVGNTTGNSRANVVNAILPKLVTVGQSYLFALPTFEKAEKERKQYVWLANKYGKANGREYVVAAVAAVAPMPAIPANPEKGIAEQPAKPGKPAGVRIWLKAITETEQPTEQGTEENGAESMENANGAAPEIAA